MVCRWRDNAPWGVEQGIIVGRSVRDQLCDAIADLERQVANSNYMCNLLRIRCEDELEPQLAAAQDQVHGLKKQYAELAEKHDAALAQVETMRSDAERYRWLRTATDITVSGMEDGERYEYSAGVLDHVVDAARAAGGERA
jgi:hypothetical protein